MNISESCTQPHVWTFIATKHLDISENIFYYVPQKKVSHTVLAHHKCE